MPNLYSFNDGGNSLPVVTLSCANGFTPQSYARALQPLYADHRVVSVNMRPLWGNSAPSSLTTWRQLGDDLLESIGSMTSEPVIGVGHSVGGIATIYAAIKQPSRFSRLILIDPTFLSPRQLWAIRLFRLIGRGQKMPFVQAALRRRRLWDSKDDAYAHLSKRTLFKRWQPDVMRDFIDSVMIPTTDGSGVTLAITPEWEAKIFETVATDVWSLPQQIKVPTLVIRGELTDVFTDNAAKMFQQRNPHARIEMVRGAGHLIPQEAPEAVGQLMADYVRQT
ncbi:MAG: alpha/beta hydrolase [Anaerolineae bacterium]|nr:alpha/beta hydrolase [Anaerolineae bacterium]